MASRDELRILQTSIYFDHLKLRRDMERLNPTADFTPMNEMATKIRASMHKEDVAWVEKQFLEMSK